MVRNYELLRRLEDEFIRGGGGLSFSHSLKLFTEMWNMAVRFGVLPSKEPLEGIEVDIRIARALNSCLKTSYRE